MNEVISQLNARKSVRAYLDKEIGNTRSFQKRTENDKDNDVL